MLIVLADENDNSLTPTQIGLCALLMMSATTIVLLVLDYFDNNDW